MRPREAEVLAEDPDVIREEIARMATKARRRAVMTRDVAACEAAERIETEAGAEVPNPETARRWWATLAWLR